MHEMLAFLGGKLLKTARSLKDGHGHSQLIRTQVLFGFLPCSIRGEMRKKIVLQVALLFLVGLIASSSQHRQTIDDQGRRWLLG